ncbi:MAG: FCD domain-containing protein [Bacillota bacterium]|nr:FCD domain-containing protein [Bacillota bacterium]
MTGRVVTAIRRRRLYQDVLEKITGLVQSGEVQVGDVFPPEKELAVKYDVSIAVVREAFRVLEHNGLVKGKQGGRRYLVNAAPSFGSLLTGLEQVVQKDLLEARRVIEGSIVRLAAERCRESDSRLLREMIEQEPAYTDNELFRIQDMEFHLAIAGVTQNSVLKRLQEYINELRAARQAFTMSAQTRQTLRQHHPPLVLAFEANDPDAAVRALSAHLDQAQAAFEAAPEFTREQD